MKAIDVKLIDPCRNVVATAQLIKRANRLTGKIDLDPMPLRLRQQFEAYEEIVNGQEFSLLDEIEEQIDALGLKVVFQDGSEVAVEDLQVYPGTGRVSFKIVKEPAHTPVRV
jgi:hypothetical protein